MINIYSNPPWTAADQQNLERFLASETGHRIVGRLMYSRPDYKHDLTLEQRALQSAKIEGYERAIADLLGTKTTNQE